MRRILLVLLAAPALLALAPLHASAQQPGAADGVVYIQKQFTGSPTPGTYTYSLVLFYNGKSCVLAQSDANGNPGPPATGASPVTVPQQTLNNMWLILTDPQWLPWYTPPAPVMQQIQAL